MQNDNWAKDDPGRSVKNLLKMYPRYIKRAFDCLGTCGETWAYFYKSKRKFGWQEKRDALLLPNGQEDYACHFLW